MDTKHVKYRPLKRNKRRTLHKQLLCPTVLLHPASLKRKSCVSFAFTPLRQKFRV
jgi:hypothetical protein